MTLDSLRRGPSESTATNNVAPPLNKRTLLGAQCWILGLFGAFSSLTPERALSAASLVALGAYLVLAPALSRDRTDGTSKFLLWAE
jgi:hypothetical protein